VEILALCLAVIYQATNLLTEIISNNAAAVIMFPIGLEISVKTAIDPLAVALLVAIVASAGFSTPIGYQTNMIVYVPGGYTYKDFFEGRDSFKHRCDDRNGVDCLLCLGLIISV
jgi:di/tricarboxylate transporter